MKKVFLLALTLSLMILASCAKTADVTISAYDRVLQAWINVNHPGLSPNDSGVFIIRYNEGGGRAMSDSCYVFAHYFRTDLKGNYASTNIDSLVERLTGTGVTYYSGSDIWRLDQGYLPNGIEPIIKGMREGGEVYLAMPTGVSTVNYTLYNAFSSSESDNVLYYFHIDKVVDDIYAYQDSILADFSAKYYEGMDSLSNGFYFKLLGRREGTDTLADEKVHPLRYMARRLEDFVLFDTNVKDTAKLYEIYSSSSAYDTLGVTRYSDVTTMISSNSVISGFARAVHEMHLGDTVEVFFRSDLGYGAAGTSSTVPEYAPLFFRIYTDPDLGVDDDE